MSCPSPSALAVQTGSDRASITLYISLEPSPSKWLVTSLVSGADKMSKHLVPGGDCRALLQLLAALKAKAERCSNMTVTVAAIQEAGLDGCGFRRFQPSIPIETSHLFRAKPAGYSDDPSRVTVRFTSGVNLA